MILILNANNVNDNWHLTLQYLISYIWTFLDFRIRLYDILYVTLTSIVSFCNFWAPLDVCRRCSYKKEMCLQLEEGKYPIVLPLQLRKKHSTDSKMPQYSVISEKNDYNQNNDEMNVSMQFYHSVCSLYY